MSSLNNAWTETSGCQSPERGMRFMPSERASATAHPVEVYFPTRCFASGLFAVELVVLYGKLALQDELVEVEARCRF
jgi:hypothetical protein